MLGETSKNVGSDLILYILFTIELLISFTAPGLLFLYILSISFPERFALLQVPVSLGNFDVAIYLLGATCVGILLGRTGDLLLQLYDRVTKFGEKTETTIIESYADIQVGAYDLGEHIKNLPQETFVTLTGMNEEQKQVYWDTLFATFKHTAKMDFRRKMNIGLSLLPMIISNFDAGHRKDLRAYISGPDSLFSFCRAVLPVILFLWLIMAFRNPSLRLVFLTSVCFLPLFYLWLTVTIRSYAFLRTCQLSMWVGLGDLSPEIRTV